jgi:outer membrane protein assembly factor BamE (lipoprotein component of BamABCDE complex)
MHVCGVMEQVFFMFVRKSALTAAAALALASLSACAPTIVSNGFQAVDVKPTDIKPGTDSRSSVLSKLGSPSAAATFDPNIWYYISQTTEKYAYYLPKLQKRDVVIITFDKDDKVKEVKSLQLKDGYVIAYARNETPTRGREVNWLEQILGTIGRGGGMINPNEVDPGQRHPGQ